MAKHKKINEKANGRRDDANENPPALTGTIEEVPVIQEDEQAKEEEAQKAEAAAYAALDEDVKHAKLKDTKDYATIRRALRKPEPSLLVFGECYTPAVSEKLGKFFCYPPVNAKGRKANPTHVQQVYKIGEDIGAQEAARLLLQYYAIFNKGKGGRPSTFPEFVEEKALYLDSVRAQYAAVTGGVMPEREFYDATQSRSVTTAAPGAKPVAQPKAAEGNPELIQTQGIAYKDGRYPLAAYLMTQLAGDTIASSKIATMTVALLLGRSGSDLDGALYQALEMKASNPDEFAHLVIVELRDLLRSVDPHVLKQMDVMQMRLDSWQERAVAFEYALARSEEDRRQLVAALTRRLELAYKMMPPDIQIEWLKTIGLIDQFPEVADARTSRAAQLHSLYEGAKGGGGGGNANAKPAAPKHPFQRIIDLKRFAKQLREEEGGADRPVPVDKDIQHFISTGEQTPEFKRKYAPFLVKMAEEAQQQQANKAQGGSN